MGIFDVDPIKALVWSAVVNGVIAVPIMVVMMLIGQSTQLMGAHTISARHRVLGWAATGLMAVAVLFMVATRVEPPGGDGRRQAGRDGFRCSARRRPPSPRR